jgi:hypothetical protein
MIAAVRDMTNGRIGVQTDGAERDGRAAHKRPYPILTTLFWPSRPWKTRRPMRWPTRPIRQDVYFDKQTAAIGATSNED